MPGLKQTGLNLYRWFDRRLGLAKPITEAAEHPIPKSSSSWWYVFGSAATVILALQVMTGILLALVYTPTARDAWNSLNFLNHGLTLGWFLRALHGWGSDFMIAIVLIHMAQVFMFGAYKFPRELTWMVGVFLLLMTLAMAFTGQVLRFDQDAYWGLGIGASIMGRVPWVGSKLVHLMLGGPIIGATTVSRFFTLHVFIIPGILIALAGVHVWMVLRLGINEWPMPGRLVRRSTYVQEYEAEIHKDGIPFVPDAAWKDALFAAAILLGIMACALFFGPIGPTGPPDPTIIQTVPKPDFPFLWIYALFALMPPKLETPILLIAPIVVICIMLALPLYAGEGEKHWSRRPVAVLMVTVIAVSLAIFTRLASKAPWSPVMNAWSADAVQPKFLKGRTPLERHGAIVFQQMQCRNCHSLDGVGGHRGPELDRIATRMTESQMIRQVLQGGGNMPAYGSALSPQQTAALVRFLETMHGSERPAEENSRQLMHKQSGQMSGGLGQPEELHFSNKAQGNISVRRNVMNHEMMMVLIWLAAAISLLVLIQVAVLGALFLMLRAVRSKGKQIERDLRTNGVDLYDLAGKFQRMLGSLETAARKTAEIVESLKQALAEVRPRLARIDRSMKNLLKRIERVSETVRHALSDPVIRLRAIAAAIQAGLGSLGRGRQEGPKVPN